MLVIPSEATDLAIEVQGTHVSERDRSAVERFLATLGMTGA
jgi:hypothetical protein